MPVALPDPIAAYFAANARLDAQTMLAPFAGDAVVRDENRTHRGREAIGAWIAEASIANSAVAAPRTARIEDGRHVVEAEVTGAFPGSPVALTFRFGLAGDRISTLEIS